MGSYPFGPHGPQTRPYDPTPNPTAQTTFPNIGGGGSSPVMGGSYGGAVGGTYAGGGTGSGGPFLSFTLSLLMLPFVWMFWICLYPMTAIASGIVGFTAAAAGARQLAADDRDVAMVGGLFLGYVTAIIVSRVEYKLAQLFAFRAVRHLLRLVLLGVLALPWIQAFVFSVAGGSELKYILYVLANPPVLIGMLANPVNLGLVAVIVVGLHFLLWKPGRVSAFWHRRLMWIGLK